MDSDNEGFSADVGDFIERLLKRQTDFETKIKEQLAGLERQISEVFAMQQSALVQACAALTELIEARTKFKPGSSSSN